MNIRGERQADYEVVERLTYEAFGTIKKPGRGDTDEHLLVHKMRSAPAFISELSLVCELEGKVVGHIAYTKSKVISADGTEHETITFGPVSVLPKYQKRGIGAALIRFTLEKAMVLGYKAVLITGHPEYYPQFGFVNAERFGITMPDGTNMDAFMALELKEGALDGVSGRWIYDSVFETDKAELAAFNEEYGYTAGYTDINSKIIDGWVDAGWEWSIPVTHEEYVGALSGDFRIFLTPTRPIPPEWFGSYYKDSKLTGADILGLASGGAQQMPILAALGAKCTVLDYSEKQLESEKMVADREGYEITIVKADMTKRLPFEDESFDIIVHPVSNCYIEDVQHVWNECYRVLRRGGILLSGVDNGVNFLLDEVDGRLVATTKMPFNPLKNPEQYEKYIKAGDGIQFSHTMEEQLGGQLRAGLTLTDLYEDRDAAGLIPEYFPQYIATKAVKMKS